MVFFSFALSVAGTYRLRFLAGKTEGAEHREGGGRTRFLGYVIVTPQKCIPKETSAPPYILARKKASRNTALTKIHAVFEYHHRY